MLLLFFVVIGCNSNTVEPYDWVENELIAHATGGIEKNTYTNSLNAFEYNYEEGHRLFEIDIEITNDNKLVARHGWEDDLGQGLNGKVSYDEFMTTLYYGEYTPMDFDMIINLMKKYQDAYVILDGKVESTKDVERLYKAIAKSLEGIDKNISDRLIPQMFYKTDLEVIRKYGFHDVIYVVGREDYSAESLAEYCDENDIRVVSLSKGRTTLELVEVLKDKDVYVYMYTLNDLEEMEYYSSIGVHGFFTDFISELESFN